MRLGGSLEIGAGAVLCAGKTESKERNLAKVRASDHAGTVLDSNFCALCLTARLSQDQPAEAVLVGGRVDEFSVQFRISTCAHWPS